MTDMNVSAFLTLAQTGDVKLAADKLCTSVSTILNNVRRLEEEFGLCFIQKDTQGIHLTASGQEFCKLFSDMQQQLKLTRRQVMRQGTDDTLSVAWCDWCGCPDGIQTGIAQFAAQIPSLRLRLRVLQSEELSAAMQTGDIDVIILSRFLAKRFLSRYPLHPLTELPLFLLTGRLTPQSGKTLPHLSAAQTAFSDLAERRILREYHDLKLPAPTIRFLPNWMTVYMETALGHGFTITPKNRLIQNPEPFAYTPLSRSVSLCAVCLRPKKPLAAELTAYLQEKRI